MVTLSCRFTPAFAIAALLGALGCASSQPPAPCGPPAPAAASGDLGPAGKAAPDAGTAAPAVVERAATVPASDAAAQADDLEKLSADDLARRLLAGSGASSVNKQTLDAVVESMKKMPGLPAGFAKRLMANARPDELTLAVASIYARSLDRETMIASIRFYESAPGKKLAETIPQIAPQVAAAGSDWSRKLVERTMKEAGGGAAKSR
jgi:hypothetical protein